MPKVELDNIRLGHSPLSDKIYAGIVNIRGGSWKYKTDVTNDFIHCIIRRWDNKEAIIESGDQKWKITVKRID